MRCSLGSLKLVWTPPLQKSEVKHIRHVKAAAGDSIKAPAMNRKQGYSPNLSINHLFPLSPLSDCPVMFDNVLDDCSGPRVVFVDSEAVEVGIEVPNVLGRHAERL